MPALLLGNVLTCMVHLQIQLLMEFSQTYTFLGWLFALNPSSTLPRKDSDSKCLAPFWEALLLQAPQRGKLRDRPPDTEPGSAGVSSRTWTESVLSFSFQDTLSFSPQLLSRLRGPWCAGYGVSLSPVLCMAPAECHARRGTQNVCRNRQRTYARASGCGSSPGLCHHPNPPDLSSRTFCRPTCSSSIPPAPMALVSGAPELEPVRAPPPTLDSPTADF